MKLKKDLLKSEKKSWFWVFIGVLSLALAISRIPDLMARNEAILARDWVLVGVLGLNGIVIFFKGLGYSEAKPFGKAFVFIDDEQISIKTGAFSKQQSAFWKEIESIEVNVNAFKIRKTDSANTSIDISKLDDALKAEIREVIQALAEEKNVPYSLVKPTLHPRDKQTRSAQV